MNKMWWRGDEEKCDEEENVESVFVLILNVIFYCVFFCNITMKKMWWRGDGRKCICTYIKCDILLFFLLQYH